MLLNLWYELVRQQYGTPFCGKLKRDYKAFKTDLIEFYFYLKTDSIPNPGTPGQLEILYDSLDFYYDQNEYEITLVKLFSYGGYMLPPIFFYDPGKKVYRH